MNKLQLFVFFVLLMVVSVSARSAVLQDVEVEENSQKMTLGRRSSLRNRENRASKLDFQSMMDKVENVQEVAIVDAQSVTNLFDAPVIPTGKVGLHGGNVFTPKGKKYGQKSRAGLTHRQLRKRSPPRRHIYASRGKYIHN